MANTATMTVSPAASSMNRHQLRGYITILP
jgi:hypothetical protein